MIVITGAAGFIGSYVTGFLLREGYRDIVLVDDFSKSNKKANWESRKVTSMVDREDLFPWIEQNHRFIQFIVHLGARTDTTEFNKEIFDKLNFNYSCKIWKYCVQYSLPLVYASSAATYGEGENGYDDDESKIKLLKPLNPYGESKNQFDLWVLAQKEKPFFWAGFKFFNVYGPNEYHKGRMASVIFHSAHQIRETGRVKLFRSHRKEYNDGEQQRDFIYVNDVASVLHYFMQHRKNPGIYNLGTGQARSFNDLVSAVFKSLNKEKIIDYVDIPADIRDKYQYFTEATTKKLRAAGYNAPFHSLEDGVNDYVSHYLTEKIIY